MRWFTESWRALTLVVGALAAQCVALAATPAQIDAARNRGLAWLYSHQQGEGGWATNDGSQAVTTHSALEAFNRAGVKGYPFHAALAYFQNLKSDSIDSLSRKLHATALAGGNGQGYVDLLVRAQLPSPNGFFGPYPAIWGPYPRYPETVADSALAMRAILAGQASGSATYPNFPIAVVNAVFCRLLQRQNGNGGWTHLSEVDFLGWDPSLVSARVSALLPTVLVGISLTEGMAITGDSGSCQSGENNMVVDASVRSVSQKVSDALNWLLTLKKADNGFGEGANSTVLETAMVYEVLSKARPSDPSLGPAMDYLLAKQNAAAVGAASSGGSWGGSALQTAYVLKVMPTPVTALADTDGDGIPNAVEALLGTNTAVPDSRWLASGNSSGLIGLAIATPLNASVFVSKASTLTFTAAGGKPPYTWSISSGALPPGYTLNAITGAIQGNAIAIGNYNFVYAVNDSASSAAVHADGRIAVVRSNLLGDINGDGVVDAVDTRLKAALAGIVFNFVGN